MQASDADMTLKELAEGTIIAMKVHTGSSRRGFEATSEERLDVYVHSPPHKGKANKEALKVLSKALGVPVSHIEITKGRTSRNKTVLVHGITPSEVRTRLGLV